MLYCSMWKKIILFFLVASTSKEMFSAVAELQVVSDCLNPYGPLFEIANVTAFVDEHRYIRLNVSWNNPIGNFSDFKLNIETNCSPIYEFQPMSVDRHFIIEPKMTHPAEPPTHGCKYVVEFFTECYIEGYDCYKQTINYEIPECVDTVCNCSVAISPYELQNIKYLRDNLYKIQFKKTKRIIDVDLERAFDRIKYRDTSDWKTELSIPENHIEYLNSENALVVPFMSFQEGKTYAVNIKLILDNCMYFFKEKVSVPKEEDDDLLKNKAVYVGIMLLLIGVVVLFLLYQYRPQVASKLKKYLPFLPSVPEIRSNSVELGLKITKELINSQYTPLEFVLNSHKYDKFEFPRNKVVIQNEIGGGSFGKVYRAEVYELSDKPGYTIVAAKQPIENAPPEEISDFLVEIDMMKQIARSGGHKNVIQILACVTIDAPYIMIMELAPCGSLKEYLSNLRKIWERKKEKKKQRHFFPDNMVIESYLPKHNSSVNGLAQPAEKLKYSELNFEPDNDDTGGSETDSYISPETPRSIPSTPGSPHKIVARPHVKKKPPSLPKGRNTKILQHTTLNNLSPKSPETPESVTSSGLPSGTETVTTLLESPLESPLTTPLIHISEEEEDVIKPVLDSDELQNFSMQIASGMAFLENLNITHRDLAARNILINENKVLKISDFGMARVGVYVSAVQKRQPLRWMAPEAIEKRSCNNKTDVWSFGVLLWEIGSLGAFPYKDLSNEQVIAFISQGKRLERPDTCTDQVYELMQRCWARDPDSRPTFDEIAKSLDSSRGKIYVDFSKLSPKYMFPPVQETVD